MSPNPGAVTTAERERVARRFFLLVRDYMLPVHVARAIEHDRRFTHGSYVDRVLCLDALLTDKGLSDAVMQLYLNHIDDLVCKFGYHEITQRWSSHLKVDKFCSSGVAADLASQIYLMIVSEAFGLNGHRGLQVARTGEERFRALGDALAQPPRE